MRYVYLSPHLDDVALSCGGLVWEQSQRGEQVEVWTICAGDPPPGPFSALAQGLHQRWGTDRQTVAQRRAEDLASCELLGAVPRHFEVPDCIYRRHPETGEALYTSEESLFGRLNPVEHGLVNTLARELTQNLPAEAHLICPLSLGGHVDHQLTRAAAERLGLPLRYYADYPYVMLYHNIDEHLPPGLEAHVFPVSSVGLANWQHSVAAHASQISTFWENEIEMKRSIRAYSERVGGVILWGDDINWP